MYARLKDEYVLRGWKGIPYGLVNTKNGGVTFLSPENFALLEYLDGETSLDLVLLSSSQRKALAGIIEKGIAVSLEHPRAIRKTQGYKKSPGYYLENLHWSITGACNLRCKHCYMGAPEHKYPDMDTEQCLRIIRQMADANVAAVTITGGEPLMRQDFWRLLDAFSAAEIAVKQIYTNGTLIDHVFFENLERRNLKPVFVLSFDGLGCHDWMRGIQGTEEKTIRAIRRLREKGFRVSIETALYAGNIDRLLPTYELLKDLGVDCWKTSAVFDSEEWGKQKNETLNAETLYGWYIELAKRYIDEGQIMDIQLDGFFGGDKNGKRYIPYVKSLPPAPDPAAGLAGYSCLSCRVHPYLLPDGRLLPCPPFTGTFVEQDMPNLRDAALGDIFSQREGRFFSVVNIRAGEVIGHNEDCGLCEHRVECRGGCRGAAVSGKNGLLGKDDRACRFFKEGYRKEAEKLILRRQQVKR
ncbi:MAG: radical SAM protein [Treponema sp.]|jgi:radical SAM protein with 4Fe4S-binding SPASM domain|nr:radical SAM protein [Treponema sp.]